MDKVLLVKILTIWFSFIPIAILNGALRETCLVPFIGERLALPLSGISGSILFFILVYCTLPWLGRLTPNHYRLIGLYWLAMTVVFEFLFGRLVAHKSWGELLQTYDIATGNLWLLVLLAITVSPYLAARHRGIIP